MSRVNMYSLLIVVHIILIAFTIIGSILVSISGNTDYLIAFLSIPLINILLIPITKKGEKWDPSHPIFMILVSLLAGTVLRSFFIISPLQSDAKFLMLMGKPPIILLTGLFAIYLGFIFFILGYGYPLKPLPDWARRKIFSKPISLKKFIPVTVFFTLISLFAAYIYFKKMGVNFSDVNDISQKRHYQVDTGSYSSLGYYRLFMDLIEPLYYGLLFYMLSKKKPVFSLLGLYTLFLGLLNLVYPFVESSRTDALYVLINSGLIIYYIRGIKWREFVYVLCTASLILVIMTNLRQTQSKTRSTTPDTNPLIIMVGSTNFLGVDKTSQIILDMPQKMNYQFGSSLFLWLLAPIPRTMWPGKPDITYGRVIGEDIYEKRDENSPGGGIPPGYVGELYLNFGYLGIVAGMFALGAVLKLFYNAFKKIRKESMYAMIIYILTFVPFSLKLIGGDFSACILKIFTSVLPIYLIIKLTQKNPENKT